jgi:AbrB family looped-hinge helix DNA binding protein
MKPHEGKRFYGAITVSERGQIVIPAEARRDFGIETGEKLLVLGDLEKGLVVVKASMLFNAIPELRSIFPLMEKKESGGDRDD